MRATDYAAGVAPAICGLPGVYRRFSMHAFVLGTRLAN